MNWMNPKSHSYNQLSIFLHAPADPGVYVLHNSVRCLYVGATENVRQSLLGHLRGDSPWITVCEPNGFAFELCSDAARVQRQHELFLQLQPVIENSDRSPDEASLEEVLDATDIRLVRF
jgi:hypothetical protein